MKSHSINSPSSLPTSALGNDSSFCFCVFVSSKHFIQTGSYRSLLCLSSLVEHSFCCSTCQYICSILLLNRISSCQLSTFCLSIHQLMDVYNVSNFGLSGITLYEHLHTSLCVDTSFHFSGQIPRSGVAGSCGNSV